MRGAVPRCARIRTIGVGAETSHRSEGPKPRQSGNADRASVSRAVSLSQWCSAGSLRLAAAGEGAEAHDPQLGEVLGACRRGRRRRRLGARSAVRRRGDVFLGACRRQRRRGGLQLYQTRAAWGATGQLSSIWLGLWVSASGGATQSASIPILPYNIQTNKQ